MSNILEVILDLVDNMTPGLEAASNAVDSLDSSVAGASASIDSIDTSQFDALQGAAESAGMSIETIGEAASMAGYDLSSIDPSPVQDTASGAGDAAGAGEDMASAFSLVEGVFSSLVGVGIGAFFDEIIDKATGSADSWNLFGAVLSQQGVSIDSAKSEIVGLADEHGFLVKNVREATKVLTQAGMSYQDVTKDGGAMNAAMAISVATGRDLTDSAVQLQRAYMGNGRALKLLGIDVEDYKNKSSGMVDREALNAAILQKLGGQLGTYGDSYEAMSTRMTNAISKLETSMGKLLLPIFSAVVEGLTGVIDAFNNLPAPIQGAISKVALFVVGIVGAHASVMGLSKVIGVDLIAQISKASGALVAFAMTPTGAAVLALAALAAILIYAGTQYGWFSSNADKATEALNQGKAAVDAAKQAQTDAQGEVDKWTQALANATPGTQAYTDASNNLANAKANLATKTQEANAAESNYNDASAAHQKVMSDYAAALENARKQVIAYKVAIGELTEEEAKELSSQSEAIAGLSQADQEIQKTTDSLNSGFTPAMTNATNAATKNPFHALLGTFADFNLDISSSTNAWETLTAMFSSPIATDPVLPIKEALQGVYCWIVGCSPGVIPAFDQLVATIFGLPGRIAGGLMSILTTVAGWAMGFINYAIMAGSGFISSIGSFLSSLPGMVWNYTSGALGAIASFAGSAWSYAVNAGRNIYNGISSGVSGIAGMVWRELNNIASTIMNAGGYLYSQAVSLGQRIYNGLKAGLGIASPGYMYHAVVNELGLIDNALSSNDLPSTTKTLGEEMTNSFSFSGNTSSSNSANGMDDGTGVVEHYHILDLKNVPEGNSDKSIATIVKGMLKDDKNIKVIDKGLGKLQGHYSRSTGA